MILLTLIAAIVARVATNFANWKIALGLTLLVLVMLNSFDRPNYNAHLVFGVVLSPIIYGVNHLLLIVIGWVKVRVVRLSQ